MDKRVLLTWQYMGTVYTEEVMCIMTDDSSTDLIIDNIFFEDSMGVFALPPHCIKQITVLEDPALESAEWPHTPNCVRGFVQQPCDCLSRMLEML